MEEHGPGLVANGGAYCSAALGRGVGNGGAYCSAAATGDLCDVEDVSGGAYCSAATTGDLCDVEDVSGGAYCSATLHGVHGDRTTAYCSGDAAAYCSGVGRAIPANNMVVSGGAIGAAHAASGANPVVASSTSQAGIVRPMPTEATSGGSTISLVHHEKGSGSDTTVPPPSAGNSGVPPRVNTNKKDLAIH